MGPRTKREAGRTAAWSPGRARDRGRIRTAVTVVLLLVTMAVAACRDREPEVVEPITAPSSTTTMPTTTTTALPPRPLRLAFSGEIVPHARVLRRAADLGKPTNRPYSFVPLLARMEPVMSVADLAICHLEVPITDRAAHVAGYPRYAAPSQLLYAVRTAGYDGCSTASEHSFDQGLSGVEQTLDRMDDLGMGHAGTARSEDEARQVMTYTVGEIRVAHLSYTYGVEPGPLPTDETWAVSSIDVDRIRADAASARADGSALVVVSLHWGTRYRSAPDAAQESLVAQLLPSDDIDLVIGHHAHVVQPIRWVGGTYVVFGLGNLIADQPRPLRSDGLTVIATAKPVYGRWRVVGLRLVPTWIDSYSFRVLPVTEMLARPNLRPDLAQLLRASYRRTVAMAESERAPGLTVAPLP